WTDMDKIKPIISKVELEDLGSNLLSDVLVHPLIPKHKHNRHGHFVHPYQAVFCLDFNKDNNICDFTIISYLPKTGPKVKASSVWHPLICGNVTECFMHECGYAETASKNYNKVYQSFYFTIPKGNDKVSYIDFCCVTKVARSYKLPFEAGDIMTFVIRHSKYPKDV